MGRGSVQMGTELLCAQHMPCLILASELSNISKITLYHFIYSAVNQYDNDTYQHTLPVCSQPGTSSKHLQHTNTQQKLAGFNKFWSPTHKHCRKTCHKIIITQYLRCHKIIGKTEQQVHCFCISWI